MNRFALTLIAAFAACNSASAAFLLHYNGLGASQVVNLSYSYVGTDNATHSGSLSVNAGIMNMTADGQGVNGSNLNFRTFCVDLFHTMTSQYMVNVTPLSTNPNANGSPTPPPLGGWLGGGMGFLYNQFLALSSPSNADAAAYQVAIWRLTLGNNATLGVTGNASVNSAASSLYTSALSHLSDTGYWLSKVNGTDGQGVLYPNQPTPVPAPGAIVLLATGGLFAGAFGKFRRRSTTLGA